MMNEYRSWVLFYLPFQLIHYVIQIFIICSEFIVTSRKDISSHVRWRTKRSPVTKLTARRGSNQQVTICCTIWLKTRRMEENITCTIVEFDRTGDWRWFFRKNLRVMKKVRKWKILKKRFIWSHWFIFLKSSIIPFLNLLWFF